jgi:glyoxylase-like metal-dependent hydrolase (beta-lactamase superfamily II)
MLRARSIQGNGQRLDGGAMFGNAPRELWSRWHLPDEYNRIELCCRALLLEVGARKILLETGIGAFFEPELRERYGITEAEHVLLSSLSRLGLGPEDIDVVVLSHLHFDHAGGLLLAWQPGAPLKLAFERAEIITSRVAFERAKAPHARDKASFIPGLAELLERSGRLRLVTREEEAKRMLGEAFSFAITNGHTPGMLHTMVQGQARSLFFCADLVPGLAWLHAPITMGYDRYPELLVDEKSELLAQVQREGTWLFFTHDPDCAAATLGRDARGRFIAQEQAATVDCDLDAATSGLDARANTPQV